MFNWRQSAGKNSLYYLIGVYLGDGCVSKYGIGVNFRLNTIDMDFAESVASALLEIVGRKPKIYTYPVSKSSKPNNSLSLGCKDFCQMLVTETNSKTEIPYWIKTSNRDRKKAFISGLMDSEGYVAKREILKNRHIYWQYTIGFKSTDVWMDDFKSILQSVEIRVTNDREEKPYREHYRTPRRLTISLPSFVESGCRFNIERKQQRLEHWKMAKDQGITLRDYMLGSHNGMKI